MKKSKNNKTQSSSRRYSSKMRDIDKANLKMSLKDEADN